MKKNIIRVKFSFKFSYVNNWDNLVWLIFSNYILIIPDVPSVWLLFQFLCHRKKFAKDLVQITFSFLCGFDLTVVSVWL